ncbi:hypothetical protein P153DRAFT_391224 [Dothidotthia symphoricarpi CBS 119687]|uniref:Uncharacterized protein n=1 Tax=Dothidotthia symphoricarpi CBS 119687 TaxID=1392245 RepID=A0A6A5ZWX2_9PLEO|nr:uncharacterized protein P153DRAFT_391224 [Dothidotthia symphoricarpi CBS 119687]KAF2123796.1 hypothetical protein P153DRAFT_391224 [Dothidotthia symphoricarpi CBS 119687]
MNSLSAFRLKLLEFVSKHPPVASEKPVITSSATTILETVTKFTTKRSTVDIFTTSTSTITQPMTVTSTATVMTTATTTSTKSVPLAVASFNMDMGMLRTSLTTLLCILFVGLPVVVLGHCIYTSFRNVATPHSGSVPATNSLRQLNFAMALFIPCGLLILHPSLTVSLTAITACTILIIFLGTLYGITELALHLWTMLKSNCQDWFNAEGWSYQPGWSRATAPIPPPLPSTTNEVLALEHMTTSQKMERQTQLFTQLNEVIRSHTPEERKQMKARLMREWCLIGEDGDGGHVQPSWDTLTIRGTHDNRDDGWPWQVDHALAATHAFDYGYMHVPEGSGHAWPRPG